MRDRCWELGTTVALTLAAGPIFIIVGACSFVVDANRNQCTTDADCAGRGLASTTCIDNVCGTVDAGVVDASDPVDPMWGCLGKVPPPRAEDRSAPVPYTLRLYDPVLAGPLVGLPVAACETNDLECTTPVDGAEQKTDTDGLADVMVFNGFDGYLKVAPNADFPRIYPTFLPALPVPDTSADALPIRRKEWPVFEKDQLKLIALTLGGAAPKDEYGHLFFSSTDCLHAHAERTVVTIDVRSSDTYPFYTDESGVPSLALQATTKDGAGGFINVPSGPVVITVRKDEGQLISTRKLFIRAGTITQAFLPPS